MNATLERITSLSDIWYHKNSIYTGMEKKSKAKTYCIEI